MSISIHINGMTVKDVKRGLQDHIERTNEADAKRISQYTTSTINPAETQFNKQFITFDGSFSKTTRDKFKAMNDKRRAEGLRAIRSNANIAIAGTLQISDDSLKAMGYDKALPWSENSEDARIRIESTYSLMVGILRKDKHLAGEVQSAALHVDESTPHVDFLATAFDENDYSFTGASILNGEKGKYKKGQKLAELQDKLDENLFDVLIKGAGYETAEKVRDTFDLKRGDSERKKKDDFKQLKNYERDLNRREAYLNDRATSLDEKEAENILDDEIRLQRHYKRENELDEKENALNARESILSEREDAVRRQETSLAEREAKVQEFDFKRLERLSEARKDYEYLETKFPQAVKMQKMLNDVDTFIKQNPTSVNRQGIEIAKKGHTALRTMVRNKIGTENADWVDAKVQNVQKQMNAVRDELEL